MRVIASRGRQNPGPSRLVSSRSAQQPQRQHRAQAPPSPTVSDPSPPPKWQSLSSAHSPAPSPRCPPPSPSATPRPTSSSPPPSACLPPLLCSTHHHLCQPNSSSLNLDAPPAGLTRANHLVDLLSSALHDCPTSTYFVVRQHAVSAADFSHAARQAPRLASHLNGESDYVKSTLVVPHVIEDESAADAISRHLQAVCGAELLSQDQTATHPEKQRVIQVSFAAPPVDRHLRPAQLDHWGELAPQRRPRIALTWRRS